MGSPPALAAATWRQQAAGKGVNNRMTSAGQLPAQLHLKWMTGVIVNEQSHSTTTSVFENRKRGTRILQVPPEAGDEESFSLT